jgi:hypothetical protein
VKVQSILEEIQTCQKNWKEHMKRMLPKLALEYQPVGKEVEVIPKRDGKTNSLNRVEEYRINKPSQRSRRRRSKTARLYKVSFSCHIEKLSPKHDLQTV